MPSMIMDTFHSQPHLGHVHRVSLCPESIALVRRLPQHGSSGMTSSIGVRNPSLQCVINLPDVFPQANMPNQELRLHCEILLLGKLFQRFLEGLNRQFLAHFLPLSDWFGNASIPLCKYRTMNLVVSFSGPR